MNELERRTLRKEFIDITFKKVSQLYAEFGKTADIVDINERLESQGKIISKSIVLNELIDEFLRI